MPTEELKEKMLFMVSLQTEQQRQCSVGDAPATIHSDDGPTTTTTNTNTIEIDPPHTPTPFPTLHQSQQPRALSTTTRITHKDFYLDPTVGTGTLTMNFETSDNSSSNKSLITSDSSALQRKAIAFQTPSAMLPSASTLKSTQSQLGNLSSYGTLDLPKDDDDRVSTNSRQQYVTENNALTDASPPTPQQAHQASSSPASNRQPQRHDFSYHHPDFVDTSHPRPRDDNDDGQPYHPYYASSSDHYQRSQHASYNSSHQRLLSRQPPPNSRTQARYCRRDYWEPLLRSFCFGGVDGLLTGSGILGAFVGFLQLLNDDDDTSSQATLRWLLMGVTASACLADALGMGVGHVWTTRSAASVQARDRLHARHELLYNSSSKSNAKGQLVDLLLQKGMLKIDAMSLADTLEGYPDLFVSALMGEPLADSAVVGSASRDDDDEEYYYADTAAPGGDAAGDGHHPLYMSDRPLRPAAASSCLPCLANAHQAMDSVSRTVSAATRQARDEAFCMMVGFVVFAMLPSLVVQGMAIWVDDDHGKQPHLLLCSMLVIAGITWAIGVWKSRFVEGSHCLAFLGIETLLIWLICTSSAYFAGRFLRTMLLPDGFALYLPSTLAKADDAA
jgi:hypothetical protein